MTSSWPPIRYREFYDIPRSVIVEWKGAIYLFDCLFDDDLDDYEPSYSVYRLPEGLGERLEDVSWTELGHLGEPIGSVETRLVEFDPTRRQSVNPSIFEPLGL